jgi:DNA (cytosine-5)-methyltransferase 1
MGLSFGSVCSGIEAASVAWHPLGWSAAWLAEIDKSASKVLAARFPNVVNHGDMTKLAGMVRRREIVAPDVLCGGTPCQSYSIAGRRLGLADPRGQLTIAFIDLADAIDEVRRADGKPPCVIIWENVPGVFTSKDNAFGCFLAGLAGEDSEVEPAGTKWTNAGCVLGPERSVAWRTLDAQFFGLAQRRRRVFVVASARDGFDPTAILFEREGVRRDSPPSRETRQDVTHAVAPCLTGSGRGVERTGDTRGQDPVIACWDDGNGREPESDFEGLLGLGVRQPARSVDEVLTFDRQSSGEYGTQPVASTIAARDYKSASDLIVHAPIAFTSKDYGGDATEDLSPTLRSGAHDESHANGGAPPAVCYAFKPGMSEAAGALIPTDDICPTLQAADNGSTRTPAVAYSVRTAQTGANGIGIDEHIAPALDVSGPSSVAYDPRTLGFNWQNGGGYGNAKDGLGITVEGTGPLQTNNTPAVAYAIQERAVCENPAAGPDGIGVRDDDCAYTLEARTTAQAVYAFQPRIARNGRGDMGDVVNALTAQAGETGKGDAAPCVALAFKPSHFTRGKDGAPSEIAPPLSADADKGDQDTLIAQATMAVRRLMPVECERLQGFPDGWTDVPVDEKGKRAADGPRYKQLGNSWAVTCVRWLGRRVGAHLATLDVFGHNGGPPLDDDFDELMGGDFEALLAA